jgi:hypothetical protein
MEQPIGVRMENKEDLDSVLSMSRERSRQRAMSDKLTDVLIE